MIDVAIVGIQNTPSAQSSVWQPHTMFKATAPALSKASRRALTPKRGNKDFYKGELIECRVNTE
jgi:hypothetical protein